MRLHANLTQLIMIMGSGVIAVTILMLIFYLVQKSLARRKKDDDSNPARIPLDDEASFTRAAVEGVIAQLKSQQKSALEELVAAERRADQNARRFNLLATELDLGLMIFDGEGFIAFSNPLARKILRVDTLSRRRFGEIFQEVTVVTELIGKCFTTRGEVRGEKVNLPGQDELTHAVEISVLPSFDRSGILDFVVCMVREQPSTES